MDDNNYRELFDEMVASQMRVNEVGLIELPLAALREFHDAIGLQPGQYCTLGFSLPGGQDGLFNYSIADVPIGTSCAITDVAFYDECTDEKASIDGDELLYKAIMRDLLNGASLVSGDLLVDQNGGLYIESSYSGDIEASIVLQAPQDSMGVLFVSEDLSKSMRVWSDGDTMFVASAYVLFYDGPPS